MTCPYCGSDQSGCIDSRQVGEYRHRRYVCHGCGKKYNTEEGVRLRPEKPSICSQCLLKQDAEALCRTCALAKGAAEWAKRRR